MALKVKISWLVSRLSRNIIFWLAFAMLHFRGTIFDYFLLVFFLAVSFGIPAYIHNMYLIPKFFLSRKYALYIPLLISLLIASCIYSYLIGNWVNKKLISLDMLAKVSGYSLYYYVFITILTFVLLSFGKLIADAVQNQLRLEDLQKNRLESELKILRSQINPHFLFNALNTIYGMVRRTDLEAAKGVLMLSDILRYNLYECNEPAISLNKEIEMIRQYITFTQLRHQNKNNIKFDITEDIGRQKIAPLLLIPFIENAFKHGLIWDSDISWVNIKLFVSGNTLFFECINSNFKMHAKDIVPDAGGIGLLNVKRRLELIYPGTHELTINDNDNEYIVQLKLVLS